jgi:serine/threonine-protein kinase
MKEASPVQVGDTIDGKYRVERIIGSGGMGIVVAAEHLRLGKTVALKFLLRHACENPEAVTRFLREGQALASITSAHVARVMDVGTLEHGEPYLVMEYLEGSDLGVLLKQRGRLPISEAVGYVIEACEAVAEAHAKGIVHRDLKPSNLFLTQGADGVPLVKVLDFGISKAVVQQRDAAPLGAGAAAATVPAVVVTSTGALVGSPLYMSPEQIRNARRVDERTDIWSIGVILYELVCGTPPFEGETLSGTLAAVSADAPRPMRSLREDVSVELELVLQRALQKTPEQRFANMAELARALEPLAPPESGPSIARIVRLLGARAAKDGTAAAIQPREDEAAPTVPSWEGNTVPATTVSPLFRARGRLALALGAATALVAWLVLGRTPPSSPSANSAPMVDAAAKTMTPGSLADAPVIAQIPAPSANPPPVPGSASASARPNDAPPEPRPSATPSPTAPRPRTQKPGAPRPSSPHPSNPAERDGTEDRK